MKPLHLWLFAALIVFSPTLLAQDRLIVLVPGYFAADFGSTRTTHEDGYFSPVILDTLRAQGFVPLTVRNLNPLGTLQENGEIVRLNLQSFAKLYPGRMFDVIAHSAGGLYLAKALTASPELPVRTVVTLSTPYHGAELADLAKQVPGFDELASFLNVKSLREFERDRIAAAVTDIRVPARVRWIALGAMQPVCGLWTCMRAEYMSAWLSLFWRWSGMDGDGVVAMQSAIHPALITSDGWALQSETWSDLKLPLDHWKLVLDPGLFLLNGEINTQWIADRQRAIYSEIARRLSY